MKSISSRQRDFAFWLRRAMESTLRLGPRQIILGNDVSWAARPSKRRATPHNRYPTGMHSHSFLEVCIALDGDAFLDVDDRRFALTPPYVAILEPGRVHSEGFVKADAGYITLWMTAAGQALLIFLVKYEPGRGWHPLHRLSLRSRFARELLKKFAVPDARMKREWVEDVQADLLAILGEVHHAETSRTPDTATDPAAERQNRIFDQVQTLLDSNYHRPILVDEVAGVVHLSPNYVNRLFAEVSGESIHRYLLRRRMENALRLRKESNLLIKQIAMRVGYSDPLYFSRAFRKYYGKWPSEMD